MKNFAFIFFMIWTSGLVSNQSIAQVTINSNTFSKERRAFIHRPYRVFLRDSSSLFNKGTGMGKDFTLMPEAFQVKGTASYGLTKGIGSSEPRRLLKNANGATANNTQVYLIDTVLVVNGIDTNRISYSYNASAKVTSSINMELQNGQWTTYGFDTCTYDSNGDKLTDLSQRWQNGQWTNYSFDTCSYDESGNKLTDLYEQWQNGQWMKYSFDTCTYDASGDKLTDLCEQWQGGMLATKSCDTLTYDANGHELTDMCEEWQYGVTTKSRDTFTYDASGNELTDLFEEWNFNNWEIYYRITWTYAANGNLFTLLCEHWENRWINYWLQTFIYDASGHQVEDSTDNWSSSKNQWDIADCALYTYDASGNMITFSFGGWAGSTWEPYSISEEVPNGPQNEVYLASYIKITYKSVNATSISISNPNIPKGFSLSQNYPDPFNPTTTISFTIPTRSSVSLKIFDILGREVATIVSQELPAGTYSRQWNAAKMSSGIYFYRLQAGSFTQTKRLVLLK